MHYVLLRLSGETAQDLDCPESTNGLSNLRRIIAELHGLE